MVLFLFLGILGNKSSAQNCQIIDSVIIKNILCFGQNSGDINLVLLDSLGNYSFAWNNLETTEDISNLSPAIYSVQIIDLNNPTCIQDTTFTITQPQDPLSSTINLYQDVFCFGDSTGVAYADVIGGTPPYSYLWDNGQTSQMANGLWAGNHSVIFTDDNGCILMDNIDIVNLYPEIVGTINILQNVSCFGACDAIAELSSSGGVLQHTYDWDIGQFYIGSGPDTAFNLCYGGHDIIIEDALGCRKTVAFTISQPDELLAQAIQVQPVQCYGFDDGISFASATGGTTPYYFVWDSIQGVSGNYNTGQNLDSLTPGIHTIFVTDANGCTASDTVVIDEPTQLEVIIVDSMIIYSYCAGTNSGQLCALASGGTPGYNYLWNDDLHQTTPCAYEIIAQYNDYTIIVMDARNCIATASFQLDSTTNSMNPDSVLVSINDVSCFGIYDGSVGISNVVGAVPPFTYSWTGPGSPAYTGTGDFISSIYAGSYAVIIEDSNGCAITVNAEVDEPDQLEYTTYNVISETCYGTCNGQIWVDVQGGTGDYYYDISEAGVFPIPSSDQVQLVNDSLVYNLCEGLHSIYVTDDNNCEGAVVWGGTWIEKVDSGAYFYPFPGVSTTDASCFNTNDGQAWISWPGADPLFTYTWETDPIGTVIDTGVSTSLLYPGDYNVVVHYADSASFGQVYSACDVVYPFTLNGPVPLLANETVTDVSCFEWNDGSILLNPTSSAPGIPTVEWDTTTSIPGSSTASSQSPLQPGTYTVTITDVDGCTITDDIIVGEPDAITSNITWTDVLCFGDATGSAQVFPSGGVGPVGGWTYSWSPSGGNSNIANNLDSNLYIVTFIDDNLCEGTDTVMINHGAEIEVTLDADINAPDGSVFHISCFGGNDGVATATSAGGVLPHTFSWSSSSNTMPIETGLFAGDVTVTVTDGNNCSESQTITLVEPDYLDPNIFENVYSTSTNGTTNEISCYGLDDGWVESQTLGGIPYADGTYLYLWVNDNTGIAVSNQYIAENLTANTSYTVTVTDVNECESQATTTILDEPVPFIADVQTTNYAGPTHAPFSVNFVDNTISIDPYSLLLIDILFTLEYPNAPFDTISCQNLSQANPPPCNDYIDLIIHSEYFPSFQPSLNYTFNVENIGLHTLWFFLTNNITGCQDSVSFDIDVQGISTSTPNVFTPNGDGWNDEFIFGEYGMEDIDVQIFNRWGQLVYSWAGQNKVWDGIGTDGTALPESVYFYVLIANGEDGHYYEKKGSITLLR